MTLSILAAFGTLVLYALAAVGLILTIALLVLPMPDDRPRVVYDPTEPRSPDLYLGRPVVRLFDRDDHRHPEHYDQYVELDPATTVAKRRGDMEDITPDRIARIQRRLEAAKERPLTLEISKQ